MRVRVYGLVVALVLLSGVAFPAGAHHALQAQYDMSKRQSFTGVLTRFAVINPHCKWFFDVKKPDGTTEKWELAAGGPQVLRANGLIRIFKAGDTYEVNYAPSRNGSPMGRVIDFKFADGRVVAMYHEDPNNPLYERN